MQDQSTLSDRFWSKIVCDLATGCWLWTAGRTGSGYGAIRLGGKRLPYEEAHRLSWILHFGPIPDDLWVLHHCDVRHCVRPDHLWLGTNEDNTADRTRKGRSASGSRNGRHTHPEAIPRGERHANAKLTADMVRIARTRRAAGETYKDIAIDYGVTPQAVFLAVKGGNWRHV